MNAISLSPCVVVLQQTHTAPCEWNPLDVWLYSHSTVHKLALVPMRVIGECVCGDTISCHLALRAVGKSCDTLSLPSTPCLSERSGP